MKQEEVKDLLTLNLQFFADGDGDGAGADGADEGADDAGTDDTAGGEKPKATEEKKFTQSQLNKMMTKEKGQGRAAVLKEFGIDPKDTKMVNMVKAMINGQKSDVEKAAEVSKKEEELEKKAMMSETKVEVLMFGVKAEFVEDAVALALMKVTDGNDLASVLETFKTKYPVWFNDETGDGKSAKSDVNKTGQKGTGASMKGAEKGKSTDAKGLGARLATERRAQTTVKQSLWS